MTETMILICVALVLDLIVAPMVFIWFRKRMMAKKPYEDIAKTCLWNLITKYRLVFEYSLDTPYRRIKLSKGEEYILFEDNPHLLEKKYYIFHNGQKQTIDFETKMEKYQNAFVYKDEDFTYWIKVYKILLEEIENTKTLFGIQLD